MQTLNFQHADYQPLSSFRLFADGIEPILEQKANLGHSLLHQLQTTLELDKLLNIFAMEAAKYADFSGLYFKSPKMSVAARGSKPAKTERQFKLLLDDDFIGVLTYALNKPISMSNYKILTKLHQYLLYPLRNCLMFQQANQLAMQDALTGLGNRRYFDQQLKRALNAAHRHHSTIGLILGDLNKFKQVNDNFGHHIGDEVLQHVAKAMQFSVRDSDCVFRFGGDEFAMLVEQANHHALEAICERVNLAMSNDPLLAKYDVGCSLGLTYLDRADTEASIFARADQALYREKMQHKKQQLSQSL